MTLFIEVSRPVQPRPWRYASPLMYRFGWLWFAFGVLRVPFREFCEAGKTWEGN